MLAQTKLTYPHWKFEGSKGVPQSVCAMVYTWSGKVLGVVVVVVHLQNWTVNEGKKMLLVCFYLFTCK